MLLWGTNAVGITCVCTCVLSCVWLVVTSGATPARLLRPWDSPGKNTGVGCPFLLQGIFPTQGSNLHLLHLPHWQVDSSPLCHLGSQLSPKVIQFLYKDKYLFLGKTTCHFCTRGTGESTPTSGHRTEPCGSTKDTSQVQSLRGLCWGLPPQRQSSTGTLGCTSVIPPSAFHLLENSLMLICW